MRSGAAADVGRLPEGDDGQAHRLEDGGQQAIGGDVVGQGLEGEDQPVSHHVAGHVEQVGRQRVVAAPEEGQGPARETA